MIPFKILYLTQFPEIGGGETILLSLLEKLNRQLFKPIVIVPKKGQLSTRLKKLNVETHFLNLPPYLIRTFFVPGASPGPMLRFIKLTKVVNPNLIHLNHLTQAIYGGVAAKMLKTPVVATAHGPWDSYYFYQDLITNIFVDKILANTNATANRLTKRKIIKTSKVAVVPFGIDTQKFKPATGNRKLAARNAFGFSKDDFITTIVGRLDPTKDHLTFLKAANIIRHKIKSARFFIVGSELGDFSGQKNSYLTQIKDFLARNPKLAAKVIFGGFIEDMPAVYHATDVLVSTSPSESFGLALAEASSCAVPIVAACKNPQLIVQHVLELFKNPKARISLGKLARNRIQKEYPLKNYVKGVNSIYRQLTSQSSL